MKGAERRIILLTPEKINLPRALKKTLHNNTWINFSTTRSWPNKHQHSKWVRSHVWPELWCLTVQIPQHLDTSTPLRVRLRCVATAAKVRRFSLRPADGLCGGSLRPSQSAAALTSDQLLRSSVLGCRGFGMRLGRTRSIEHSTH